MPIPGVNSQDPNMQAFNALNAKKQEQVQKQTQEESTTEKLNAPVQKDDEAASIFKLSVEKEQGKGNNLNFIG